MFNNSTNLLKTICQILETYFNSQHFFLPDIYFCRLFINFFVFRNELAIYFQMRLLEDMDEKRKLCSSSAKSKSHYLQKEGQKQNQNALYKKRAWGVHGIFA